MLWMDLRGELCRTWDAMMMASLTMVELWVQNDLWTLKESLTKQQGSMREASSMMSADSKLKELWMKTEL